MSYMRRGRVLMPVQPTFPDWDVDGRRTPQERWIGPAGISVHRCKLKPGPASDYVKGEPLTWEEFFDQEAAEGRRRRAGEEGELR